jgi:regulator of protease activity HflC (stomatin/prohibitin superfamily)
MKGVDAAMAAGPEGTLPWLVTGALVLAALAAAMVRVVPEHQRAVVLRFGRVARVADPGLIALLPGIERLVRIFLRESSLERLRTRATTLDDVTVWVTVTARYRVVDPVRSHTAVSDVDTRTAEVIEEIVRAEVERTTLEDLAHASPGRTERLVREANSIASRWGTRVSDVEIGIINLQLTGELLHWAKRLRSNRTRSRAPRAG